MNWVYNYLAVGCGVHLMSLARARQKYPIYIHAITAVMNIFFWPLGLMYTASLDEKDFK